MKFSLNTILTVLGAVQTIYEIGKGVVKTVKKTKTVEVTETVTEPVETKTK